MTREAISFGNRQMSEPALSLFCRRFDSNAKFNIWIVYVKEQRLLVNGVTANKMQFACNFAQLKSATLAPKSDKRRAKFSPFVSSFSIARPQFRRWSKSGS